MNCIQKSPHDSCYNSLGSGASTVTAADRQFMNSLGSGASTVTAPDRQCMTWVQKRAFYASTCVGKSRFWACKVTVTWHLVKNHFRHCLVHFEGNAACT